MTKFLNSLKKLKWKHYINYIVIAFFTVLFAILASTGNLKTSSIIILEKIAVSIILAVSLSLVVGFLGELSLGHAGFMCIGAYIGGKLASVLSASINSEFAVFLISLVAGGLCASVFGLIIGLPALRLKGDYLAIVTLAFGEIVRVLFQQSETFGGNLGLSTPRYDKKVFFVIAFLLVLFTLFIIQNLMRSKHGRAITSIRDNEIAAKATGVPVTEYKLMVFALSAFFAGIAGVMFSFTNSTVQAPKFGYNYSIEILVMVVLGGMSIGGSIISATLVTLLNEKLRIVLTGDVAVVKDIVYSLILISLIIYNNAPALKNFREKYNIRKLLSRFDRKKTDPGVIHDDDSKWDRIPTKIAMDELLSVDLSASDEYKAKKEDKR